MELKQIFDNLPYLNVTEFARRIDINPALMRRYACGECTPSEKQCARIRDGFKDIAREIQKYTL